MKVAVKRGYTVPFDQAATWAVASAIAGELVLLVTKSQWDARELISLASDIALDQRQVRRVVRTQGMESVDFIGGGRVAFSTDVRRGREGWLILHVSES